MALTPGKIQFISNYPGWQCIKKFAITELTDPKTVSEFFVSYSISLDNRMERYLAQFLDMKKVQELISAAPSGKTAGDVPAMLEYVSSPSLQQKAHAIANASRMDKSFHSTLGKLAHAHIIRGIFKQNGLSGDYSGVEIPGLKRLMKKKKGI